MMLFINKMFLLLEFEDYILHKNVNFQQLFVVKMTERREKRHWDVCQSEGEKSKIPVQIIHKIFAFLLHAYPQICISHESIQSWT